MSGGGGIGGELNSREEGFYGRVVIDEGSEGMSGVFNVSAQRKQKKGKKEKDKEMMACGEDGGGLFQDFSGCPEIN